MEHHGQVHVVSNCVDPMGGTDTAAVTVAGVILGAVGAWLASQVSWPDLVTAAIGLLLMLLAAGVVYLYGRYLYQP